MVSKAELNKAIFALFSLCSLPTAAVAQEALITTDGTTATQITTPDSNNFDINGGDKAGGNLFHSFGNFSVPDGGSANFLNSPDIVNIINRVTGGNISEINGLLKANGSANLFLINPAGIIFGQNARLDIGGSFLGSTADSLVFPDGEFSALNAQGKPLLTINAPIGLNLRDNPNSITNNSTPGLEVKSGNNISLVGGDINLEGGMITAPAGRVELGSLNGSGQVKFNENGSLSFPDEVARGNVSLSNGAFVDVAGTQGGDIGITADNIQMTGNSYLVGGTYFATVPLSGFPSGDINLNATGKIDLDRSFIFNSVATSNAGNINITASSLNVNDDSRFANIANSTFGVGNAGNITINAKDNVSLNGGTIASNVEEGAVGNGGEIKIDTGTVKLNNGAQIQTLVRQAEKNLPAGEGIAGNIIINSRDAVTLDGKSSDGKSFSEIISDLDTGAEGKAGNIEITTANLKLTNRASISSNTSGKGDAGNITVNTKDNVLLEDGVALSSRVKRGAEGNGGQIKIDTGSLKLIRGGQILTNVSEADENLPAGQGNAGNIIINARDGVTLDGKFNNLFSLITSDLRTGAEGKAGNIEITTGNLSLTNGVGITSETFGKGDAGNITVNAKDNVSLDKDGAILSDLNTVAEGKAGNIEITTANLKLTNRASISSSTFGKGDAGNITVNAKDNVSLDGNGSVILSTLEAGAVGDGGQVKIDTGSLNLKRGGQIQSLVRGESRRNLPPGQGNAGNVIINARDAVNIDGKPSDDGLSSGIFSRLETGAEGKAGNIAITTTNLALTNDATIDSSTSGKGNAGDVTVNAKNDVSLDNDAIISSRVDARAVGDGGQVKIDTGSLNLNRGGQIQSLVRESTRNLPPGQGNAGNVIVNARNAVTVDGKSSKGRFSSISSALNIGAEGKAGNIEIATGNLTLSNGAEIVSGTAGKGDAGNVTVNAKDNVSLNASTILSTVEAGAIGNGGQVKIDTGSFNLKNGGQILTIVNRARNIPPGQGNAGNVIVTARDAVTIDGTSSDGRFFSGIASVLDIGAVGKAGNIEITTGNLSLTNGATIDSSTFGIGNAGNIAITAKSLTLDNSVIFAINAPSESISSNEGQFNTGGNITINFRDTLKLRGGSKISAQATGDANGGNININASDGFIVAFPDDNDIIATADRGRGGNIAIDVTRVYGFDKNRIQQITEDRDIILSNGENDINSSSGNPQLSGAIQINTDLLDPAKERAKTTENVVEPDETVASACDSGGDTTGNTFTVSGRGGIPPSPTEPLRSIIIAGESRSTEVEKQRGRGAEEPRSSDDKGVTLVKATRPVSSDEIIPARGMMINEKGQIVLTRYPTPNASQRTAPQSNYCSSSLKQQEPLATNTQSDSSEETLNSETIEELMNLLYSMNSEK